MNRRRIVAELDALARFLEMGYLPETAAAVRSLAVEDVRERDFEIWLGPLLEVYREELVFSRNILGEPDADHHRALLAGMDELLSWGSSRPDAWWPFFFEARPVVEAVGESHGNTRELYRSFVAPESSHKHMYLNLCLMYLILCEGVFPNQSRLVLGLHELANRPSSGKRLTSVDLSAGALAGRLHELDLDVFAAGYHRHIRNAIAHGHVRYDPKSKEMRFRDYNYRQGMKVVFDQAWPFEKFAWEYARMDDTYWVMSTYLQVHFLPFMPRSDIDPSGRSG